MVILDDVKTMLGIEDTFQDNVINIYTRNVAVKVRKHLNLDSDDTTDVTVLYPDAIINETIINMNKRGNEGLSSFAQGAVSGTYESAGLSQSTKDLLPTPYVEMY